MKSFVVWGMGILAAWALMGGAATAQPAVSLEVGGGSGLIAFEPGGSRTAVLLSTFSTAPTELTFFKEDGPVALPLSLGQLNAGAEAWQGLVFSLSGGSFAAPPTLTSGGPSVTPFGLNDDQAQLLFGVNPGVFAFVDLEIDLDQGSQAVLTVTPIVPEPATGAVVVVTTLLLGCRRVRG